jgi:hypothetical protein
MVRTGVTGPSSWLQKSNAFVCDDEGDQELRGEAPMMRSFLTGVGGMALVALFSQQATAAQGSDSDVYDVRELYNTCSVAPDSAEYTAASFGCLGFIGGAVQYHDAVSDRKHLKRLICYPKGATVTDGRAVFVEWGKRNLANEERMDELAVVGLVRALAEKYPCR